MGYLYIFSSIYHVYSGVYDKSKIPYISGNHLSVCFIPSEILLIISENIQNSQVSLASSVNAPYGNARLPEIGSPKKCGSIADGFSTPRSSITVPCLDSAGQAKRGRYVGIERAVTNEQNRLNFCEVEVWGCPTGTWGYNIPDVNDCLLDIESRDLTIITAPHA